MVEPVYQVNDSSCIFIVFSAVQKLAFDMLKTWDSGDVRVILAFQFSIRRVSVALYDASQRRRLSPQVLPFGFLISLLALRTHVLLHTGNAFAPFAPRTVKLYLDIVSTRIMNRKFSHDKKQNLRCCPHLFWLVTWLRFLISPQRYGINL